MGLHGDPVARVEGLDRLSAKLRRLELEILKAASRGVRASAILVESDAKQSIRQPGTGRVYTHYFWTDGAGRLRRGKERDKPHQASAPGQPPASDHGDLLGSVETSLFDGGLVALIGTGLEYGKHLEFGTARVEPRPWLRPAFNRNVDRARDIILTQIDRATKRVAK